MKLNRSLSLLLALLLVASTLSAQTAPQPGEKIDRFEVVGNASVASDTIRVYLGVHPGQPYDPGAIQRNFANLWQTGLFDDIRIEADRADTGGVLVRAIVKERPRIASVEYRGNKNLSATKIGEALEVDKIDLHVGNTIEQTLVRRAAETIRRAYAETGYEGVTVQPTVEDARTPNEKKIVFTINEGIKARIAGIDFTGNKRFSDRRLRSEMKSVKKSNIYTRLRKRDLYIPSKLDEDLEGVRNFYLDHGYKDVQFGDPQIVTQRGRKPRVKLVIPVKEGDVHTFGEVTIEGNSVFTTDQVIGRWPLQKGETLSRKPVQGRIELFEELYRRRGHIYAYMNPEYRERDNNVVDIHIQVFEGEQFRLGRLEFEGNSVTKDKVLRREIFLEEGQVMDMETFKASLYKLGQLGYFKITENPDFKVNQESKTVDITIKGQEEGKNDLQFGGGYSETYGFFGQFQFFTRNFLGEGEGFGINYQRGRRQDFFSLSYSDPWFLDRPHSLGISVYNRETVLPDSVGLRSRGKGGSVSYGFRLDRFESLSMLYAYERRKEHQEFVTAPDENGNIPLPVISDNEFTTSALVPSYRYDSRDNPYDTFQGTRISLSASYSGGPLGGSIDVLKPVLSMTRFHRLGRTSAISMNVEGGQIFPLEDNCANTFAELDEFDNQLCVPRSERFFVGGEYTLRGFKSYSVGPQEETASGNLNVGGYKYSVFNLEYIQKINDPLRVVFFADAGNAYAHGADWDLSDLRYSVGAELRVFLPVFQFPLRFIYAFNPDEREGDRFEAFQFSVGNSF
jgi:outer membrane protein insertion porin family